jgi:hypothetical protein
MRTLGVLFTAMRDQHRTRQELSVEVTALRKQVADLKEAMLARRRVEDALRRAEEQLRTPASAFCMPTARRWWPTGRSPTSWDTTPRPSCSV